MRVCSQGLSITLLLCTYVQVAYAGDAQTAQQLYDKGAYAEATVVLESAIANQPNVPVLHYNLGATTYRQEEYERSVAALNQASALGDASLLGVAAYNRGNARVRQAEQIVSAVPQEAMTLYEQAQEDYALAIVQNPADRDAQFNYELIAKRLAQLKQQAQQQAQQEQQATQAEQQEQQSQSSDQGQGEEEETQEQAQAQQDVQPDKQDAQDAEEAQQSAQQPGAAEEAAQDASSTSAGASSNTDTQPIEQGQQADGDTTDATGNAARELSAQEALWILDAMRDQEQRSLESSGAHRAQDATVERDW